jgi:predicted  nucleic acid-binding Zn-ribbon protein
MSYDSAQAHDRALDRIRALEQRITELERTNQELKQRLRDSDDENEAQAEERFSQADRIAELEAFVREAADWGFNRDKAARLLAKGRAA